jgi:Domain of unknown function (DUF4166)
MQNASSSIVSDWLGEEFFTLHPLLQSLHLHGGHLSGNIQVTVPRGIAGVIGMRLAKKLGVPTNGSTHQLDVTIAHQNGCLLWNRCFDQVNWMKSTFVPIGTKANGYWLEQTGPLSMKLNVDTRDGGWYWCCLSMRLHNVPLPLFLMPRTLAYKKIEDNKYRFYVGFSLPLIGTVLSYSGLLVLSAAGVNVG